MSDLISRQDALDAVNNAFDRETLLNGFVRSIAVRAIRDLPTIEPERHGRWIHPYEYGLALPEHKCSVCGEWEYADSESNYCPNCGAYMRGKK